jgi:hypothetical protein
MVQDFFDNTVLYEKKTKTSDGLGGFTAVWGGTGNQFSVKCYKRQLNANEIRVDDKLKAICTERIYSELVTVDNTWRATVNGKIYEITGVLNRPDYTQADVRILE